MPNFSIMNFVITNFFSTNLKVHWHEMVKVIDSNFFAPGHFVLTKKGAWAQKFIYRATRVH